MEEDVVELCSQLVRMDTTNWGGGDARGERDAAELVAERLDGVGIASEFYEPAPRRTSLVARVTGKRSDLPALLVQGHLDVVPAESGTWSVDPFAGDVSDGTVWGRGTVDMKGMCAQVVSVVCDWARTNRAPRRDIVLAFVADEEDGGRLGAQWLVAEHPELFDGCDEAIGEFGGFRFRVEGVNLYPVGVGERGSVWLKLTARGTAGHGSRANPDNAVVHLVSALHRIAAHEWPIVSTPCVRTYLSQVGRALGREIETSDITRALSQVGGAATLAESTVRNSAVPTVLDAGSKVNTVPERATAMIDGRFVADSDSLLSVIDRLMGEKVNREIIDEAPALEAPSDGPLFESISRAIKSEDPGGIVVPYCLAGRTDAKAFARLGIAGYGFSPLLLPDGVEYRSLAHGVDERVPVEGLQFGARVLDRFLSSC